MNKRREVAELRRDAEFEAFTAGAGGRLLHTAALLTGDLGQAERLLTATLARTYADWLRMRADDPYDQARAELVRRFASRPWWRRPRGGVLARLTAQERLVVTMRFFEGVAEEQVAAQLGLGTDRVRAICFRATATLRSRRFEAADGSSDGGAGAWDGSGAAGGSGAAPGSGVTAGSGGTGDGSGAADASGAVRALAPPRTVAEARARAADAATASVEDPVAAVVESGGRTASTEAEADQGVPR